MEKVIKTTSAEFQKFKTEFLKWQKILNLGGWKVFFDHKKLDGRYANIAYDMMGRVATVGFAL